MSKSEARAWWADVEHLRAQSDASAGEPSTRPRPEAVAAPPARRTVLITGRGAPAAVPVPRALVDAERRRPARSAEVRNAGRPDRVAMWAVLLGFALVLIAATSAQAATRLGDRTLHVPMKGRDVRQLQSQLKDRGLLPASATALYGPLTRTAVRRYQRSRCLPVDGIAGPATIAALRSRAPRCESSTRAGSGGARSRSNLRSRVVTWYGPGMYGRRTACGDKLTSRLLGVAHRTLPCGTRVRFVHGGRDVVARVVDRGPHVAGVHYDLTWAAARRLGVLAAGRAAVRASR